MWDTQARVKIQNWRLHVRALKTNIWNKIVTRTLMIYIYIIDNSYYWPQEVCQIYTIYIWHFSSCQKIMTVHSVQWLYWHVVSGDSFTSNCLVLVYRASKCNLQCSIINLRTAAYVSHFVCLSYMARTDRHSPTAFFVRCSANTSPLFIVK